ncbi:hypothetical protein IHE29_06365 [Mycetohabitans rhizoxinica]|uniref:Transposase n=1 Tax=Mycetohabitans rhizoxinica TaxID=412963 RepID=A0ABZ2PVD6_9BURK
MWRRKAQNREDARRTQHIAERQRPCRIAEAQHHGQIDVLWRGDLLLDDIARDMDDRGDDALRDKAG